MNQSIQLVQDESSCHIEQDDDIPFDGWKQVWEICKQQEGMEFFDDKDSTQKPMMVSPQFCFGAVFAIPPLFFTQCVCPMNFQFPNPFHIGL